MDVESVICRAGAGVAAYLAAPQAAWLLYSWMTEGRPVLITSAVREVVGDHVRGVSTRPLAWIISGGVSVAWPLICVAAAREKLSDRRRE
ncbi:hypothetical protein AB0D08_39415 [Kitasatospora sp. NPDC048540]|uniref:hypothetical protein n=1 Tax=unclassified Kitasatospora TaxID=2633591 RepID=UPI00053B023E|nr:hypothetical protein [Kitasatospora sp. MBT63]